MPALSPEEVIEQNNIAAEYVVLTEGPVDRGIAELVLRNTAAVASSLSRDQFAALGEPTINALLDAAASASRLAPLSEERLIKHSGESEQQHQFRTKVQLPFRSLKEAVDSGAFDGADEQATKDLKTAVWLSRVAFEAVVNDSEADEHGRIARTVSALGSNALAAARRAQYLESHSAAEIEADKQRRFAGPAVSMHEPPVNEWERGYNGSSMQ